VRIKAEWLSWRRNYRKRELNLIFSECPKKLFQTGLELGAGDGFQSTLLTKYVSKLICTDFNPDRLKRESSESIEHRICDAEEVGEIFGRRQFDLVYSSNLLEHLPNPDRALSGICEVLKDDGITIHVMPSPFWKLCHLLLHIPNLCAIVLEKTTEKGGLTWMLRKIRESTYNSERNRDELGFENNPKIQRNPRSFIHRLLAPEPHGVSDSNIKEFYAFSKSRWKKEFEEANLDLVKIIKGPVASAYGFGFDRIRSVLERLGFTSEYIYILVRNGENSHYLNYF
jgi:SAM-dependent methyltransferase